MPRNGRQIASIIASAVCVSSLPSLLGGGLPGERRLSANDDHAKRFGLAGAKLFAADVRLPVPSGIVGAMLGARLGFGAGFAAAFLGPTAGQSTACFARRGLLRQHDAEPRGG